MGFKRKSFFRIHSLAIHFRDLKAEKNLLFFDSYPNWKTQQEALFKADLLSIKLRL